MRGQIQPWFNILDFESLESMMCLALKLKKDVWFSFFLAAPKCKHNLHCCCFFGHLWSKFVSPPLPESFSWPLVSRFRKPGKSGACLSDLPQILLAFDFLFLLKPWVKSSPPALPVAQVLCILWTALQEGSLPSLPRSAHAEWKWVRLWQIWQSACVLSLAKMKNQMNKWIY